MRSAVRISILCLAVMAVPAQADPVGDYRGLPADLAAAATAYDLAQFKSNRSELERLLADDYVLFGSSGKNQTKAQYIADATAPGSKTTSVVLKMLIRHVWADGAVLGGMVDAKGVDHGKPFTMRARFADVWAKRNGRWQVVFTQANLVK